MITVGDGRGSFRKKLVEGRIERRLFGFLPGLEKPDTYTAAYDTEEQNYRDDYLCC